MGKEVQIIIVLLLIPSLLEAVHGDVFLIAIPGSPLSLGRITFILSGMIALVGGKNLFFKNHIFYAFVLIFAGLFTGAILATDIVDSLSKTIALVLIFIGLCGLSKLWHLKYFQYLLDAFFLLVFVYWTYYVLSHTLEDGKFLPYTVLFINKEVINHHIPGMNISISAVYLATRLFIRTKYFRILAWLLLFAAILLCLVIDSRSNFLFTSLASLIILLFSQKSMAKVAMFVIPLIIVGSFFLYEYVSQYDSIVQRFDVQDTEYQSRTNDVRLVLLDLAFKNLLDNPLGNGAGDLRLKYDAYRNFLVHNQFLSFIVGGGILAVLGVCLWIMTILRLLLKVFSRKGFNEYNIYIVAFSVLFFTFHLTLLTIDSTGLMFFIILSMLVYSTNTVLHTQPLITT
jgi:hypothetical protein